ncbi:hypothetical protein [Aliivibrio fischeri]|uniref:hypothetical protein n=1 Tax=Aliivibrio fischeri TaxID=668 RepID=UPI0007C49131|nr:hypothetical protein [Aliivibrio fischeri]
MCSQITLSVAKNHQEALEHASQFTFLNIKDRTALTLASNMKDLAAHCLWGSLSSIEINVDDEIISDWFTFESGTNRFDIWKWFESTFDMNVTALLHDNQDSNFIHDRCHEPVSFDSISKGYIAFCTHCDEDLLSFEVSKAITQ